MRTDEGVQWVAQERPAGAFLRQLDLGDGWLSTGSRRRTTPGVLTVTIPVAERAKARRITVETGGRGRTSIAPERAVQGEVTTG